MAEMIPDYQQLILLIWNLNKFNSQYAEQIPILFFMSINKFPIRLWNTCLKNK